MKTVIIKNKITQEELKKLAENSYGTVIKVAVDVKKEILAAGGEWHSEEQDILVKEEKSDAAEIWGTNFHPFEIGDRRIEYISLINLKPEIGHKRMEIDDPTLRNKIKAIVEKLLLKNDEILES